MVLRSTLLRVQVAEIRLAGPRRLIELSRLAGMNDDDSTTSDERREFLLECALQEAHDLGIHRNEIGL